MSRREKGRVPREVYPDQAGIERKIFNHLFRTQFCYPLVSEVYIYGSLNGGQFGIFCEPEHPDDPEPKLASDVDLLVVGNDNFPVPGDWRAREPFIVDLYRLPTLDGIESIEDGIHTVTAMVYLPSEGNRPAYIRKGKLEGSPFESMTREIAFKHLLKTKNTRLWYKK
jgi:hypothetical protein